MQSRSGAPVLLAASGGGDRLALVIEHRSRPLFGFFEAVKDTMMTLVHWVLWAAPFGVFALALVTGARTGLGAVGVLGHYVIIVSIMCLSMAVIAVVLAVLFA